MLKPTKHLFVSWCLLNDAPPLLRILVVRSLRRAPSLLGHQVLVLAFILSSGNVVDSTHERPSVVGQTVNVEDFFFFDIFQG